VNLKGNKEVLGLWTNEAEGARLWLQVLTDIKNCGVADIFIACVDGLSGFPTAIKTVFPQGGVPDVGEGLVDGAKLNCKKKLRLCVREVVGVEAAPY